MPISSWVRVQCVSPLSHSNDLELVLQGQEKTGFLRNRFFLFSWYTNARIVIVRQGVQGPLTYPPQPQKKKKKKKNWSGKNFDARYSYSCKTKAGPYQIPLKQPQNLGLASFSSRHALSFWYSHVLVVVNDRVGSAEIGVFRNGFGLDRSLNGWLIRFQGLGIGFSCRDGRDKWVGQVWWEREIRFWIFSYFGNLRQFYYSKQTNNREVVCKISSFWCNNPSCALP